VKLSIFGGAFFSLRGERVGLAKGWSWMVIDLSVCLTTRADFAVTIGNSRYFYDIQIVALSKDSARDDSSLTMASCLYLAAHDSGV
jgi:hypothetical protein